MGGAKVRDGAPQEMLWLQTTDALPSLTFPVQQLVSRLQNATQNSASSASQGHLVFALAPDSAHPVVLAVASLLWVPLLQS